MNKRQKTSDKLEFVTARNKSYILLLIATVIWGVAGPVIKYTLEFFPPIIFLFYRLALAGGFAAITLSFSHHAGWPKDHGQKFWILMFCFLSSTVALALLFLGYAKTSALTGSILSAVYPILTALIGMWFLHEHITHRENIGMGIALAGTALIVAEPYLTGLPSASSSLEGELLVIASLIVGVIATVLAKLLLRHKLSAFALTQLTFLVGFITTIPIALHYYSFAEIIQSIMSAPLGAHLGVLFMAFVSGTIAYSIWNIGQKSIEIGESAMFSYLYPIITLPLSLFWLHEHISWIYVLSAAVIAVGIWVAETKPAKRR